MLSHIEIWLSQYKTKHQTNNLLDRRIVSLFNWLKRKRERSSPEADSCFEKGADHIMASRYYEAIMDFTRLIKMEKHSVRGYLWRADARVAEAAEIVENYRASGGQQFQLNWEELNAPSNQSLQPPEKDKWWKLNERIMKLQHEAKNDYEKVLQLDPHNLHAMEMHQDLVDKENALDI